MTDMRHRYIVFILVTVSAATVDQGIKVVMVNLLIDSRPIEVAPFLMFRLGYNTGVSFSMFAETFREAPLLVAAIQSGLVSLFATLVLRSGGRLQFVGVALIAGGAAGNIIDRIRLGMVVDYIDVFYARWHWPSFNLADAWISIGMAMLIVGALASKRPNLNP